MKTRIEKIPVFENVQTGEVDKVIFIADDGREFENEKRANLHNEHLLKTKLYKEAIERMQLREFYILGELYFIFKTTTLEDLHLFENNVSSYCKNTEEKYFTNDEWVIGKMHDGGDYRDSLIYDKISEFENEFKLISDYIKDK